LSLIDAGVRRTKDEPVLEGRLACIETVAVLLEQCRRTTQ